jgi:hypothetical protein
MTLREQDDAMGLSVIPTAIETLRYALGDLGWIEDDAKAAGRVPMDSHVGHAKRRIERVVQLLESVPQRRGSRDENVAVRHDSARLRRGSLARLGVVSQ